MARGLLDDFLSVFDGPRRSARSRSASAPWVKLSTDAPARLRRGRRHACGVVTSATKRGAVVRWKDGGSSFVPLRYLRRATAADVRANPHGMASATTEGGGGALALDKRALWRAIERERKKEARAKVAGLRETYKTARATRASAIGRTKAECRAARGSARALAREVREQARIEALAIREAARQTCAMGEGIASTARGEVKRTKADLDAERAYQRSLRVTERAAKARKQTTKRATRAERAQESDDQVRANIDPALRPLFEKVKRQIKGSARKSRTEAFLEYVEAHPREEYHAIEDATERMIAEMERRQWEG